MVLVVISLILLTDYFGESPSSPLHTIQRGIVAVLSPIQQGASTVLSPVRDVGNWFSNTFRAASEVKSLRRRNQRLTTELAQAQYAEAQLAQLRAQIRLDNSNGINTYHPVAADVISHDASLWYQHIELDVGTSENVQVGDPVIGDGALVGAVSSAGSGYCIVTLITDPDMAVAGEVNDSKVDSGVLVPAVGDPNQLVMKYLPSNAQGLSDGELVVTVGFKNGTTQDLYPAGIPIGTVTNANPDTLASNQTVQVAPAADLRHLSTVQVLTAPHAVNVRAQLP